MHTLIIFQSITLMFSVSQLYTNIDKLFSCAKTMSAVKVDKGKQERFETLQTQIEPLQ